MDLEKLKYPIGNFTYNPNSAAVMKTTWIKSIVDLPKRIETALAGASDADVKMTYRPEAWTVAQVIHHLADSHMTAYLRTKLALTQDLPNVNGYEESVWSELKDATSVDVSSSLHILKGLHARWGHTFENMEAADFEKQYYHVGYKKNFDLMTVLSLYAWHSEHHLAHLHQALKLKGEFA